MDAQTLYSIVKTWPLAAWPANVVCEEKLLHEKVTDTRFRESAGSTVRDPLKDAHAVLLFEAAGIHFLHRQQTPTHYVCIQRGRFDAEQARIVCCSPITETWTDLSGGFAPTLIEAISKALLAVEGREG